MLNSIQTNKGCLLSNVTISMLNLLQRLKIYGTEDDNYGDSIILKNQILIKNLKNTNEMDIYLYLLNNVSILEKDLLEAHKHFNEVMMINYNENHFN